MTIVKRSILAVLLASGLTVAVQAHEQGAVPSDPGLAERYQAGMKAYLDQDYATALAAWQSVAEQGGSAAQLFLGFMAAGGQGQAPDAAAAAAWYHRAAAQDNKLAQIRLAMAYRHGAGVPRDPIRAHLWASLAARDHKHLENVATAMREAVEAEMTPDQVAEAERLKRDWLATHKKAE